MTHTSPHRVVHVDVQGGLAALVDGSDDNVFAVFWNGDRPLGHARLSPEQRASLGSLADLAAGEIAPAVAWYLWPDSYSGPTPERLPAAEAKAFDAGAALAIERPLIGIKEASEPRPALVTVSVIVCTRDRPHDLLGCLRSLERSASPPDEVVVVDNSPSSGSTKQVVDMFLDVRYVPEENVGLSLARNTGVRAATGEVLAFVDDDATVHPAWLERLVRLFANPDVGAVTGLVLPQELDTPAQAVFEFLGGGFSQGYRGIVFDRGFLERTRRHCTPVWQMGAGANMAVRRDAFREVGLFDERLGAGRAGCSEDSELWYRLLASGWECRYDPSAVVFHRHRRDASELYRQAHDYMRGHTAALFVQYARHRDIGNLRRVVGALPRHYLGRAWRDSRRTEPEIVRKRFRAELTGYLRGLAYVRFAFRAPPLGKRRLAAFLGRNPFPHPFTEGFFYREKMRAIHRVAPDVPMLDVLEVGGGRSGLARLLYPNARITTVDNDASHADSPLNKEPSVTFVCADAKSLPFADSSFDVVTLFDVLEHVSDDRSAAREALRVLRPGGYLLVTSPNERWRFPFYSAYRGVCPTAAEMQAEWGHVRTGYSIDDLRALLGLVPDRTATFISPLTVLCHDLGFSRLRGGVRRALATALAPLTWIAYWLHRPAGPGTETASSWRKPA